MRRLDRSNSRDFFPDIAAGLLMKRDGLFSRHNTIVCPLNNPLHFHNINRIPYTICPLEDICNYKKAGVFSKKYVQMVNIYLMKVVLILVTSFIVNDDLTAFLSFWQSFFFPFYYFSNLLSINNSWYFMIFLIVSHLPKFNNLSMYRI